MDNYLGKTAPQQSDSAAVLFKAKHGGFCDLNLCGIILLIDLSS